MLQAKRVFEVLAERARQNVDGERLVVDADDANVGGLDAEFVAADDFVFFGQLRLRRVVLDAGRGVGDELVAEAFGVFRDDHHLEVLRREVLLDRAVDVEHLDAADTLFGVGAVGLQMGADISDALRYQVIEKLLDA